MAVIFISIVIVIGLLPSMGSTMGQERGTVVEEMPEISIPSNTTSSPEPET